MSWHIAFGQNSLCIATETANRVVKCVLFKGLRVNYNIYIDIKGLDILCEEL